MRKILVSLLFNCCIAFADAQPKTPAQLYGDLFDAVQMQKIYSDGKTFADASPRRSPEKILKDYQALKNKPDFNLDAFVKQNFNAPATNSTPFKSDINAGIRKHIDTLWTVLQRVADTVKGTSLIPLPHSYVVPGGRFREVYYWDSYFTMLGLEESHRYKVIEDEVKNFAYLIDTYGHIPNGNRTYYLSRSQPPFFSLMVEVLAKTKGPKTLVTYQPELLKEYQYFMHGGEALKPGTANEHVVRLNDGTLLNRYYDASDKPREESYREDVLIAKKSEQKPGDLYRNIRAAAESGWDFSSRWLADGKNLYTIQTTNLIPVDLNCLMYHLETVIAKSYQLKGNKKSAALYLAKAYKRKAALNKYCWDNNTNCYVDYNWKLKMQSPLINIATAFPLYFAIADQNQALKIAALVKSKFLQSGGVSTTLLKTGQQWDRPNGWAPLQYITIMGLKNYHQDSLAKEIALRWIKVNTTGFKQTGKLLEKYNLESHGAMAGGGEYPLQDGFGWTNGVLLKLMNDYGIEGEKR